MRKEKYYRYLFLIGAIWNWSATTIFFFAYEQIFSLAGMEVPANPLFLRLFLSLAFVFGIGYYWVSRDITNNHAIVKLGIMGKLCVFVLMTYYWVEGYVKLSLVPTGVVDLIFAILYLEFLFYFPSVRKD
jgi:hypothetical protein